MRTDKNILLQGLRYLAFTVILMFAAPFAIYQAFKNQEHPLYIPVLIIGFILAIAAIAMGFYSIRTIVKSLFGR